MQKISDTLKNITESKRLGLMTHTVIGYPNQKESEDFVGTMDRVGVDFMEIQIPFSDPLADGPVILAANVESLKSGMNVEKAFKFAKKVTGQAETPILFMCYYNTVFNMGIRRFCEQAKKAGIQGAIIPDYNIDQESHEGLLAEMSKNNLAFIPLVAPTTDETRLKAIAKLDPLFVYCVARLGITGSKTDVSKQLNDYLGSVRKHIKSPLALGFGIKDTDQIKAIRKLQNRPEIVIIGSEVIRQYNAGGNKRVGEYLGEITKAL